MRFEWGHWIVIGVILVWHFLSNVLEGINQRLRDRVHYLLGYAEGKAGFDNRYKEVDND